MLFEIRAQLRDDVIRNLPMGSSFGVAEALDTRLWSLQEAEETLAFVENQLIAGNGVRQAKECFDTTQLK